METWILVLFMACIAGAALYAFLQLEKERQIEIVEEWLLAAVVQAEKELGSGTGQIKLSFVYNMFISKFKFLSKIITFGQFSMLVDGALDVMKHMINSNEKVQKYIGGDNGGEQ